ncbi:MAG: DUF4339 domain-containing protein [Oscillospiraceae bacterium]|nr:DUF4339 domain-containing protein [Oscillospiraceae bacterium]MCL2279690.1 DUF4339 domain-containing protein [Oscillospiraceae bacterium]
MAEQKQNCYLGINGKQHGPISEAEVQRMYDNGEITGKTKFICSGMTAWVNLSDMENFFPPLPPQEPTQPPREGVLQANQSPSASSQTEFTEDTSDPAVSDDEKNKKGNALGNIKEKVSAIFSNARQKQQEKAAEKKEKPKKEKPIKEAKPKKEKPPKKGKAKEETAEETDAEAAPETEEETAKAKAPQEETTESDTETVVTLGDELDLEIAGLEAAGPEAAEEENPKKGKPKKAKKETKEGEAPKKRKLLLIIIGAIVLVLLAAAVVLLFDPLGFGLFGGGLLTANSAADDVFVVQGDASGLDIDSENFDDDSMPEDASTENNDGDSNDDSNDVSAINGDIDTSNTSESGDETVSDEADSDETASDVTGDEDIDYAVNRIREEIIQAIHVGDTLLEVERYLTRRSDRITGGVVGDFTKIDGVILTIRVGLDFFWSVDEFIEHLNDDSVRLIYSMDWYIDVDSFIYNVRVSTLDDLHINSVSVEFIHAEDIESGIIDDPFDDSGIETGTGIFTGTPFGLEGLNPQFWT